MKHTATLTATALALGLSACISDGNSNRISLHLGLDQSASLARSISAIQGIELSKATAHLEKIELKSKGLECKDDSTKAECKTEDSHIKTDSMTVNLLDSTAAISFGDLPSANYTTLKLKIDSPNSDTSYAFVVEGKADGLPFRMQYDFDAELQFKSAAPIVFNGGTLTLAGLLQTQTWLDPKAINACRSDKNARLIGDTLIINDKYDCSGLESKIKNAIQASGRIEKD